MPFELRLALRIEERGLTLEDLRSAIIAAMELEE